MPIAIHLKDFKLLLAPRAKASHKGDFGHVLIIGGYLSMAGAVCLASNAALRTGAGLVSVATYPSHVSAILSQRPEVMVHGIKQAEALAPLLTKATVMVLGPGLGQSNWSYVLWQQALNTPMVKVIDADALNLLANYPQYNSNWILTPHLGEAARLLGCTVHDIQQNRITAIQLLQQQYGGCVVLKGADTLVYDGKELAICQQGNPGMASGGMGDLLSGVISALLAQGFHLSQAAQCGVVLHATAGDLAAQYGQRGMVASDLLPYIRQLVNPISHKLLK